MRPLSAAFALVLLAASGCSTPSKPAATPTPTPTLRANGKAAPFDVAALPAAHQADAARLQPNVASSLIFIQQMLDEHKPTMEQVTCYCCGKSLAQCYLDTATKAAKACSPL